MPAAATATSPPISPSSTSRRFDPKAPPPKTPAFWDIVDANRAPEDAELADVLDKLGNPDATTLIQIANARDRRLRGLDQGPQEPPRYPLPVRAMRLRAGP